MEIYIVYLRGMVSWVEKQQSSTLWTIKEWKMDNKMEESHTD